MKIAHSLLIVIAFMIGGPALAAGASGWSAITGAAIRLLPGDATSEGRGLAGLEIKLDEGWKTYWRSPGDAGIPPVFDWSKSLNLAHVTVLWPAPTRVDDEGGSSAIYRGDTILPLRVTAVDPAKPVVLNLALSYAICHDICVPAKGEASLTLDRDNAGGEGGEAIAAAAGRVPTVAPIGAPDPVAIRAVHVDTTTKPATVSIDVATPMPGSLFVEGPANWYLPMPAPDKADPRHFVLPLDGLPKNAVISGTSLNFTLSTGDGGVESLYRLP